MSAGTLICNVSISCLRTYSDLQRLTINLTKSMHVDVIFRVFDVCQVIMGP